MGYSDETLIDDKPVSYYKELKQEAQKQIDYITPKIENYKEPFDAYQSLAGEIEARNVQARMDMTELLTRAEKAEEHRIMYLYRLKVHSTRAFTIAARLAGKIRIFIIKEQ